MTRPVSDACLDELVAMVKEWAEAHDLTAGPADIIWNSVRGVAFMTVVFEHPPMAFKLDVKR